MDNGGRPGPLMELTLSQFYTAKEENTTDGTKCYVIDIFKHKTSVTHGPARIVFSQCLHSWFKIFVENIRGKFYGLPQQGNSSIFVAHTGKPMASSSCSGRLTSLWGKALPTKNGLKMKMSNTMIRKSITTHIRKYHDDMKHHVADKLLHKISTSDKYYNVVRKGEQAVDTSVFISKVFKGTSSSTATKPHPPNQPKQEVSRALSFLLAHPLLNCLIFVHMFTEYSPIIVLVNLPWLQGEKIFSINIGSTP